MKPLKTILLSFLLVSSFSIFSQEAPSISDKTWKGNDHFHFYYGENEVQIKMDKMAWESFSLIVPETDLSKSPSISITAKSNVTIHLRIDIIDSTNSNRTSNPIIHVLKGTNEWVTLTYDFSEMEDWIDLKKVHQFQFFVNPGKRHSGAITLKKVVLGNQASNKKNASIKNNSVKLFPNPATDQITVILKKELFDEIKIFDPRGILILNHSIPASNQSKISIEKLPPGIYSMELMSENQRICSKVFVVQ